MRTFEIKEGPIDVRTEQPTGRVCFVFESVEMDVRLFRTMTLIEAMDFYNHLGRVIAGKESTDGQG